METANRIFSLQHHLLMHKQGCKASLCPAVSALQHPCLSGLFSRHCRTKLSCFQCSCSLPGLHSLARALSRCLPLLRQLCPEPRNTAFPLPALKHSCFLL